MQTQKQYEMEHPCHSCSNTRITISIVSCNITLSLQHSCSSSRITFEGQAIASEKKKEEKKLLDAHF